LPAATALYCTHRGKGEQVIADCTQTKLTVYVRTVSSSILILKGIHLGSCSTYDFIWWSRTHRHDWYNFSCGNNLQLDERRHKWWKDCHRRYAIFAPISKLTLLK